MFFQAILDIIKTRQVRSINIQVVPLRFTVIFLLLPGYLGTSYAADSIGLLDAVRLTLAKNPDIQIPGIRV